MIIKEIGADVDQLSIRGRAWAGSSVFVDQGFTVEVTREESKACNWPGDNTRGLLCPNGQDKPFLPNGTLRKNPARICTYGPGGTRIEGGCHHLWYNQHGHDELWPVPVQPDAFEDFLAELRRRAAKQEKANYCLADANAPRVVEGPRVYSNVPNEPSWTQTRTCAGHHRACRDWAMPLECQLGVPLDPLEGPVNPPQTEWRWVSTGNRWSASWSAPFRGPTRPRPGWMRDLPARDSVECVEGIAGLRRLRTNIRTEVLEGHSINGCQSNSNGYLECYNYGREQGGMGIGIRGERRVTYYASYSEQRCSEVEVWSSD